MDEPSTSKTMKKVKIKNKKQISSAQKQNDVRPSTSSQKLHQKKKPSTTKPKTNYLKPRPYWYYLDLKTSSDLSSSSNSSFDGRCLVKSIRRNPKKRTRKKIEKKQSMKIPAKTVAKSDESKKRKKSPFVTKEEYEQRKKKIIEKYGEDVLIEPQKLNFDQDYSIDVTNPKYMVQLPVPKRDREAARDTFVEDLISGDIVRKPFKFNYNKYALMFSKIPSSRRLDVKETSSEKVLRKKVG
uniref:CSON004399 protein n=1 Tax=Culicoides sonorensis TaxID=179676 RepID=A0A336KB52_CULSO